MKGKSHLYPMGAGGGPVQADETFVGRESGKKKAKTAYRDKMKALSVVDREANTMTDQACQYGPLSSKLADHQTVHHSKHEYVRGEA